MKNLKEISHSNNFNQEGICSDNYQLLGITNAAQFLYDQEFNEYRNDCENLDPDERANFYINGQTEKKFNSLYGEVAISVPILRKKGFYPSFIDPWKRDSEEVERLVFMSFINGLSTRDLEDILKDFNIGCSKSKVSRINKRYYKLIEEIQNRNLSDISYCIVSIDATYVNILSDDPEEKHYSKKPMLRVLGLNTETGYWELLDLRVYEHENAASYIEFLENLKMRGLTNPALILRDMHLGISAAIKKVFPKSFNQGCLFHLCQNVYRKLPLNVEKELKEQIYSLVREENPELRKKDLDELIEMYGKKYPGVVKTLLNGLEECTAWSVLNSEFKTNNVNERNNEEDKRLLKSKGSFKSTYSAECILTINTLNYLSRLTLKKPADFDKIRDMNLRFRAIGQLIEDNVFDFLMDSDIPVDPPAFSTPILWLDTIDISYESFGQTVYVKILVCYGLKKAHRRRHFLWACPIFENNPQELEQILEKLKAKAKKEPEIIVLPADDTILFDRVRSVFSQCHIQVDLSSFKETVADLLPEKYKQGFLNTFKCAFDHAGHEPEITREILQHLENSLVYHQLESALKVFRKLKLYLMTFVNIGINYFYNFKSTNNLKNSLLLKREDNENNYSFFRRTFEAVRMKTWDVPCVYMDEIKVLFDRF